MLRPRLHCCRRPPVELSLTPGLSGPLCCSASTAGQKAAEEKEEAEEAVSGLGSGG